MRTVTTTPCGRRPISAGHLHQMALARAHADAMAQPERPALDNIDKWDLLRDLGTARARFGLSDRTLFVLSVLLGFHKPRVLDADDGLIVYASNAAISDRAHGMPDSTLRRHLATLVKAGLLTRHDSPNGKRYIRYGADGEVRAFGFDLRPLLIRAPEILSAAREAQAEADAKSALREEISLLLRDIRKLTDYAADHGHTVPCEAADQLVLTNRTLRRKLTRDDLTALRDRLAPLVDNLTDILLAEVPVSLPETEEMSTDDSQNERHIQVSDRVSSDLKEGCPLAEVLTHCPDILPFAERPPNSWEEMVQLTTRIAPMTGVDPQTWDEACRIMGPRDAAATLAGIVQRIETIRSPGAYLRQLSKKAGRGEYSPKALIRARRREAA